MDNDRFELQENATALGKGSYGEVYKGVDKTTGEEVAIKKLLDNDDVFVESARKELVSLKKLRDHDNVVKLLDEVTENQRLYLVMEYCDKGDLENYLKTAEPNLEQKLEIMQQSASALNFMHNLDPPVIHRDLKLTNILLKSVARGDEGTDEVIVKICDFGVAKIFEATDSAQEQLMQTDTGTFAFRAPEFFNKEEDGTLKKYTSAVDTFALGLVFQVVTNYGIEGKHVAPKPVGDTGKGPIFSIAMDMTVNREKGLRPPILFYIRPGEAKPLPEIKALVSRMTAYEPKDRPTMACVDQQLQTLFTERSKALNPRKDVTEVMKIDENVPSTFLLHLLTILHQQYTVPGGSKSKVSKHFSNVLFYFVFFVFWCIDRLYQLTAEKKDAVSIHRWRKCCVAMVIFLLLGAAVSYHSVMMVLSVAYHCTSSVYGLAATVTIVMSYCYKQVEI